MTDEATPLTRMACQFSVYPLRQPTASPGVEAAVGAVAGEGVSVRVQPLSTLMTGDEDTLFAALRAAFDAARAHGSTVLIATLTSGLPSDQRVAEIQRDQAGG
jgi:uncharacterized protein YqgV (UPF0045/DUF77 family)